MALARRLCWCSAKIAGSSKPFASAPCSLPSRRNVCSSPSMRQSCMSAWAIGQYGTNEVLRYSEEIPVPTVSSPSDVMIKVHATSLNPLDVLMRGGYGAKLLKLRRDPLSVMDSGCEFPLVLGRDVSGEVVDCGSEVTHFAPGDEVWAAVPPWKQGSLAEYVTLTEYEVSHKPELLSHTEAASIPYVASTAVSALVNAGGLCRDTSSDKRVLITGGSGGVGTFSIQLLKAWGAHVTVTCSQNAEGLVRGLGADEVVDYTAGDVAEQLGTMEKFDLILDNIGGDTEQQAMGLLKPWAGAKYITLVTPLLLNTDSMGLLDGAVNAGFTLHTKAIQPPGPFVHGSIQLVSLARFSCSSHTLSGLLWTCHFPLGDHSAIEPSSVKLLVSTE
ncbi:reticulon-4-interacting protein 1 homolog, mitochondrial-like isoform X2 [Echeneis naucrates]|uniref:reticulon-4-interacting protein 1 homolog, mitochondrial-like isoform X2 n=1 Tax=Echeneis naucrates TaxID=173247 RepID=UPI001113FF8B|nr:reticulon-4-interacting protein 1 homolog, mitochondrial-like isoform X2 [Echeneis naucrates]